MDADTLGKDARQIKTEMFEGSPSVLIQAPDAETFRIFVYTLDEGDDERIAGRLEEVLLVLTSSRGRVRMT